MAAINSGTSHTRKQRNTGRTYGSRKKAIDAGPKKPPTPKQPTKAMRDRMASGKATKSDIRTIAKHNKFTRDFGKIGTQRGRNQGRLNGIKADRKGGIHGHGSRTTGRGVDNGARGQRNATGSGNVNQHRNVGGKSGRYNHTPKAGQSFRRAKSVAKKIAKKALRVIDKATSRIFGPFGIPLPPSVLRSIMPRGPGDNQT